MASQLQLRGGTTAQHATFIGAEREITVDTDKNTLVVHDGVTQGGFLIKDKNQVASSTNVNPDSVSIANNTLNLANSYFNYTAGITDKGYTLTSRDVTKSVDLSGVSDGLKWVSENSDGTNSFYDVKPSYGLYTKTSADDNRPVFIDGKWYSTVGGELVTNGTFDTDTSGWNTQLYGVDGSGNISFTLDNNVISVSNNIYDGSTVYTEIQTEIGKEYYITTDTITGINRASYLGVSSSLVWPDSTFASQTSINIGGSILERLEFKFIAKSTTSYIHLRVNSSASDTVYFDNISVYAVEPTLGTEILPTPSFIKNPVYIDNQIPQYIDYSQELVTNVMDSTVIDGDLEVTGDVRGKNQCTAWVNFDGTTTPPTIRDSYNVSDVVFISTSRFRVYIDNLDNTDYNWIVMAGSRAIVSGFTKDIGFIEFTLNASTDGSYANSTEISVEIKGGKS